MEFYGRERELERLRDFFPDVQRKRAEILVVAGRRRIGKTRLILESVRDTKKLYFFVTRKKIVELLSEWQEMLVQELGGSFAGKLASFEQFLLSLFAYAREHSLVVIFDEFQNFFYSRKEIYSVFQKVFDLNKDGSSLLFIFSGSSFSLMEKIFKGSKEPLFGRASDVLELSYLSLQAQEDFMTDEGLTSARDRVLFFSIFDGVPKYWEAVNQSSGENFLQRLKNVLITKEWIWDEGESILKEEFGKDYVTYFSILSAVAKGRRILSEIEQYAGVKDATVYLQRLEKIYSFLERRLPLTEAKNRRSRKGRWYIKDNFFKFWFGLLEPKRYLKEIGQVELAADLISQAVPAHVGLVFEEMVYRRLVEEDFLGISLSRVGKYWDRKGEVEVDMVAVDDFNKEAFFFEVKLSKEKMTEKVKMKLRENSEKIPELARHEKHYYLVYPAGEEVVYEEI